MTSNPNLPQWANTPCFEYHYDSEYPTEQLPSESQFSFWLEQGLLHLAQQPLNRLPEPPGVHQHILLSISFISSAHMAELNHSFRNKSGPTNVLSFPAKSPLTTPLYSLGDMVFCPEKMQDEAEKGHIPLPHHCAHLAVHSLLHLFGFTHDNEDDFAQMAKHEIAILETLHIPNPYHEAPDCR